MITTDLDAEFTKIVDELTRRGLLAGGLGSAALFGLLGCDSSDGAAPLGSHDAQWQFTDDHGQTITLPRPPSRIAVLADSLTVTLWSAGLRTIVAAPQILASKSLFDAVGMTEAVRAEIVVTNTTGTGSETSLERLAEAKPDLILTTDTSESWDKVGSVPLDTIAPLAFFDVLTPAFETIMKRVDDFVLSMGVSPVDATDRARFDQQCETLRGVLADKPDLRVGVVYAGEATLNFNVVQMWNYMKTLDSLGMHFCEGIGTTKPGQFANEVSYENVLGLPVDALIIWAGGVPDNAAWRAMPAVKADNVLDLSQEFFLQSYAHFADVFGQITTLVQHAEPGTGPR